MLIIIPIVLGGYFESRERRIINRCTLLEIQAATNDSPEAALRSNECDLDLQDFRTMVMVIDLAFKALGVGGLGVAWHGRRREKTKFTSNHPDEFMGRVREIREVQTAATSQLSGLLESVTGLRKSVERLEPKPPVGNYQPSETTISCDSPVYEEEAKENARLDRDQYGREIESITTPLPQGPNDEYKNPTHLI